MCSPWSHTCPLIVPNTFHPELIITNSEQITEKDTVECEQGRLFLGPDVTYLGVLDPKLEKWYLVYSRLGPLAATQKCALEPYLWSFFLRTFLVLALKAPCPRSLLSPR